MNHWTLAGLALHGSKALLMRLLMEMVSDTTKRSWDCSSRRPVSLVLVDAMRFLYSKQR